MILGLIEFMLGFLVFGLDIIFLIFGIFISFIVVIIWFVLFFFYLFFKLGIRNL